MAKNYLKNRAFGGELGTGGMSLDEGGNITDPSYDILKSPTKKTEPAKSGIVGPPSPTNVPGQTPQQAATGKTPAPKIAPTPTRQVQTAEKDVIANFSKYLNRTPNQTELAEYMRLAPGEVESRLQNAQQDAYAKGGTAELDKGQLAADALNDTTDDGLTPFERGEGIEGYDKALAEQASQTTEEKWKVPTFDSIMEGLGIEKLEAKDYSGDYTALRDNLDAQLESIDLQYEQEYEALTAKNENLSAALKAKLIKAGVDPNGTSFTSAVDSQIARNEAELKKLQNYRDQQKAAARRGYSQDYLTLSKNERDDYFNTQVQKFNMYQQAMGTSVNVWQAFSNRSLQEQQLEAEADKFSEETKRFWYSYSQDERMNRYNRIMDAAEQGFFDMNNPDKVKELNWLEKSVGAEPNSIVNVAFGGMNNRLVDIWYKSTMAESMEASTAESKALLPYKIQKYETEIAQSRASAAKSLASLDSTTQTTANTALKKIEEAFFDESDPDSYAVGDIEKDEDGNIIGYKLDTRKYKMAMNDFVEAVDPDLKNENYYKDVFMDQFPPNALLNENDKSAEVLINQYKKKGEWTF